MPNVQRFDVDKYVFPHTVRFRAWLPALLRTDAVTIGRTIYLRGRYGSSYLHAHEFMHVLQWEDHGRLGFAIRYLWESLRHGYHNNRFEVEARQYGADNAGEYEELIAEEGP